MKIFGLTKEEMMQSIKYNKEKTISKNTLIVFTVSLIASLVSLSCAHKNTKAQTQKFADKLMQDEFNISGAYHWSFKLMGSQQISSHKFYADSIEYAMKGKIHSTQYTMQKLSYDKTIHKWIGQDTDSIVYVLFFKNVTDSTLILYKHKCKNKGLKEALDFKLPKPDATEDHGWNTYRKNTNDEQEILPIAGTYVSNGKALLLSDEQILIDKKNYTKLSYHSGERRWVGQFKDEYLQVFFKNFSNKDTIALSLKTYINLEKAYKTKYNEANWIDYVKN